MTTFNLAVPGLGVTLQYSTTSGGSYTSIAQVKSIDGPSFEIGVWESTGLSSTSKENLPTIFSGGELTATIIYNPAETTHASMTTHMLAKDVLYWKLNFPAVIGPGASGTAAHYAFAGYLTGFSVSGIEPESDIEAAIKITITGDVTIS